MKLYVLILIFFAFTDSYSQIGNPPYPIIFIHGINSDEETWNDVVKFLNKSFSISANNKLNFVLNARGGDTTNYTEDVLMPQYDINGNLVNKLVNSNIFLINFKNFWNRDNDNPKIIIHSNDGPGTFLSQSKSNESAIYKQGYALSSCIKKVLEVTGADKVILIGHSMGGLAIREYLQRSEDNGEMKWWINPKDIDNGHKVAKVITLSTPHLGSNAFNVFFVGINEASEAIRDLKFTYDLGITSAYLFGNSEINISGLAFNNEDVNCNGNSTDNITGISSGTSFNNLCPLPSNINYTWVVSKSTPTGDGCVDVDRQWLYNHSKIAEPINVADTLMTNKIHADFLGFKGITRDVKTILRALDEPDTKEFAYPLKFNTYYSGYITTQTKGANEDIDYYKILIPEEGNLYVNISGSNCGLTDMALISDLDLITKNVNSKSVTLEQNVTEKEYFIRIRGKGNKNSKLKSYKLKVNFLSKKLTNGLVAYYRFNGNSNDESGNNNNASQVWGAVSYVNGISQQAIKFGGISKPGHVKIPNSNSLKFQNELSISYWTTIDSYDGMDGLGKYISDEAPACVFAKSHDRTGFHSKNAATKNGNFGSGFSNNYFNSPSFNLSGIRKHIYLLKNWIYVTYVINKDNGYVYLDGLLNYSQSNIEVNFSIANKEDLYFGKFSDNWYPYNGKIDEFRIYNRALTPEEILQLYNAFKN